MASAKKRYQWETDAAFPGGKTSLGVLVDWLTVADNYARWKGVGSVKQTKEALCGEVVGLCRAHGIPHRNGGSIRSKIQQLESAHESATAWLAANASSAFPSEEVRRRVLLICPQFYALDAKLGDEAIHAAVRAAPCGSKKRKQTRKAARAAMVDSLSERRGQLYTVEAGGQESAQLGTTKVQPRPQPSPAEEQPLLALDKRKAQAELAILQTELARKRLKLDEETALARKRLQDAGVSPQQVEAALVAAQRPDKAS